MRKALIIYLLLCSPFYNLMSYGQIPAKPGLISSEPSQDWDKVYKLLNQRLAIIEEMEGFLDKQQIEKKLIKSISRKRTKYQRYLELNKEFSSKSLKSIESIDRKFISSLTKWFSKLSKNEQLNGNEVDYITQLEGIENRITVALLKYNEQVTNTNRLDLLFKSGYNFTPPEVKF